MKKEVGKASKALDEADKRLKKVSKRVHGVKTEEDQKKEISGIDHEMKEIDTQIKKAGQKLMPFMPQKFKRQIADDPLPSLESRDLLEQHLEGDVKDAWKLQILDWFKKPSYGWEKGLPFPNLWERLGGKKLQRHKGKSPEEAMRRVEKLFEMAEIDFTGREQTEMLVDNVLINNEYRTFCFSAQLIQALMDTPVDRVPAEMIRLPIPATYLDFSETEILFPFPENTKIVTRGVLLTIVNTKLFIMTLRYAEDFKNDPIAYATNTFNLPSEGDFILPEQLNMQFEADVNIEQDSLEQEINEATRKSLELTINALLYINSANADLREEWLASSTDAKIKKAKGKSKRDLKKHRQKMGKVTRAGFYLHIPNISDKGSGDATGYKIGVRYLCRGHWNTYWTGPKRLTQKAVMKWIKPHWKGPETADKIHDKIYVVDSKDKV